MDKIERDLRFLKIYAVVMTFACAALFVIVFVRTNREKLEELSVERINIVEADGRLRMVISNQSRQHPGSMDGKTFEERKGQRPPGLMFFGANGNEVGGLVFDGDQAKGQGGSLTFDKFRGDQTIQFVHDEDEAGNYFAGLKMNDQNLPLKALIDRENEIAKLPKKEARDLATKALRDQGLLVNERVRVGRDRDKSSVVQLKDAQGRVRIEMKVESGGAAKLNFLDGLGHVTESLPKH